IDIDSEILEEVEEQFDDLTFAQFCRQLGSLRFEGGRSHPLLILADFELPIYITTGYHDFLEEALRQGGRDPQTEICRWHNQLEKIPSVFDNGHYEPSPERPLVYHLHGFDEYPDSLVLTEDDYLKFLVAASQNVGRATDPIHRRVRQAMSDSSLMLLDYGLQNWDFRSLFWGLIQLRTRTLTSVVSIQLEPSEVEKQYFDKYLDEHDFKVTWTKLDEYMSELHKGVSSG
ncbi:SIR2 family protein, partial [Chloroflexi bacterium TSY]|nr:SIR2 family protein [Chloroflexi bacterium TSY]